MTNDPHTALRSLSGKRCWTNAGQSAALSAFQSNLFPGLPQAGLARCPPRRPWKAQNVWVLESHGAKPRPLTLAQAWPVSHQDHQLPGGLVCYTSADVWAYIFTLFPSFSLSVLFCSLRSLFLPSFFFLFFFGLSVSCIRVFYQISGGSFLFLVHLFLKLFFLNSV